MKTVIVEKSKLLEHLRTNREAHITDFAEAIDGYHKTVIKKLEERLKAAQAGEDVSLRIEVSKPISQLSSYDEAISMLVWNTNDLIELDRAEFRQYVQDEWAWKNEFVTTASLYKG